MHISDSSKVLLL